MTYKYYEAGRYAAESRDCSIRAFAAVTGEDYAVAHARFTKLGRKPRHRTRDSITTTIVNAYGGFRLVKRSGTLERFVREHPSGRFLVRIRGHVLAVIDGTILDMIEPRPRWLVKKAYRYERTDV